MRKIAFWLSVLFIFSIPWEATIVIPRIGTATRFIGLAVAAFWILTVIITGKFRKPGLFHLAFIGFVLWNVISIYWSSDVDNTLYRLVTYVQLLGLILIIWDLYTTREAIIIALQAYIIGAYVTIFSTIINYVTGNTQGEYLRYSASGFNPNTVGVILALGVLIAIGLATSNEGIARSRFLRFVNFAFVPVALLAIALSGTRTAILALVPGIAFAVASLSRLSLVARIGLFVFFTLALIFLFPVVQDLPAFQRLGTTGSSLAEGDLSGRTIIWRDGLDSFVEHPFLGVGSNMYRSVNSLGKVAHNSFLSVLVEVGLIGFALFGLIVIVTFLESLRHPRWQAFFWLALLATWAIGASSLSWEARKPTWLVLTLIVTSAALYVPRTYDAAKPALSRNMASEVAASFQEPGRVVRN